MTGFVPVRFDLSELTVNRSELFRFPKPLPARSRLVLTW